MYVYHTQSWSQDERFHSFWRHFEAGENWRKHHLRSRNQRNEQQNPCSSVNSVKNVNFDNRKRGYIPENYEKEEQRSPEVVEMEEISEEMKEFMEKTRKHRLERDAKRREEAEKAKKEKGWLNAECPDYIDLHKLSVRGRNERTVEHKDEQAAVVAKRARAQEAYGKDSQKILAMETVMELQFEKEYAEKKPQLWPNIPLKF